MSQSFYEFYCPVKIIAGHSALEHLPFELSVENATRPMILTDKGVKANNLLDPVLAALAASGIEPPVIYDDVPPDSSLGTVQKVAQVYRQHQCDAIIAIGGGSVIDTSKAVNILVTEGGDDLTQYSGAYNLPKKLKPFYLVPTTAGTGAEVTIIAVISDTEKEVKIPFASPFLMPNATFIDTRMTLTLPPHITAMTAMDAMTHAIESYTSLQSNPMSEAYATAAIKMISRNILKVLADPSNAEGRLALAQASTMAGIAFSNSMVGLVHSLGHSLGAVAHLPHGLCMSVFLPYVLEYNMEVSQDRIGDLLLPLAGSDVYANTPAASRASAVVNHIRALRDQIYNITKLPRNLRETGKVSKDQFAAIAARAIDDASIVYNPKESTKEDLLQILDKAW